MGELFIAVLNMSLTASYVIIFVMIIRLLLKKAPKVISYALWGLVAFRLIIPFSFESIFSLMPRNTNTVPISYNIIYQQSPQINSGIELVDSFVSQSLSAPTIGASVNPLQIYVEAGTYIWILGIIALLVYSFVSILVLKRQLKSAKIIKKNIYEATSLKTPFILGFIKPKIYLPVGLNLEERGYILLHEQIHINRKDHIIKVLAFLILSVHWFNPLVWIAFILMSTDMELSCDEEVLKRMNEDVKKSYANSLLSLATGRRIVNGSPLAFGEGNVRERIKNVLNYKKPRFWVVLVSVIVLIGAGIALLSNPTGSQDLSMLNIKNLATISYQKNELLVSRAPGKNEGFNVSARAIAEYLDSVKWDEKKMDLLVELPVTLQIEWNEDQELRFYGSEPLLAMVRMNEQWRYYTIGQNDYETILSIIETASSPQSILNGTVEELWKSRTKYVGDNSAVGKIISFLPVPGDIQYDHFELHTSVQPYDIEIVYSTSSEILNKYDTEEMIKSNPFRKNALILLALVDNAEGVRAVLTDSKREVGFINTREWADYTVGEDIRNYAESSEKLLELIEMPLTEAVSNEDIIIDIGQSTKFTEEEIIQAINTVIGDFDFKGCILKKVWYDEEKSDYATKGYLGTGKGSVNGVKSENVIIVFSEFDVDSLGGDGSFEPNLTYDDWQFILIRDNNTSDWRIDDWGY
jgi:beta-lactamase regulating signal transducer with metallopeptidase domain